MKDNQQLKLGLMRHGLETGGSVKFYFSSLKQQLSSGFSLSLLPAYYYQLSIPEIKAMMTDFLPDLDVLYASNGNTPDYVIAPFYLRDKLGLDIPIIYQALGEFPRGAAGFRKIYSYFRPSDTIIFSSSADQAIYHKLIEYMPCDDQVLHFGIDTDHFSPKDEENRHRMRKQLGIEDDAFLLLYVGRITAEKNVQALLDSFKSVYKAHSKAYLLLLGNIEDVPFREFGTGPHDLQEKFRELPLGECIKNIRFFGGVAGEELPAFYSAADLFVNFSLHHDENFGYTQVEAMACGLPLVVSNWGGLRDTVAEDCGIKIAIHNTGHGLRIDKYQAIQSILQFIENDNFRKSCSQNARQRAIDKFQLANHGRDVSNLVLESAQRPTTASFEKPQLSELGERLVQHGQEYHQGKHETLFSTEDESSSLYSELISPYHDSISESGKDIVYSLASPYTSLYPQKISISDPLWPFEIRDISEAQTTILKFIAENEFLQPSQLPDAFDRNDFTSEIDMLVKLGLVLKS